MEKVIWVTSRLKALGAAETDGLAEVNAYLENGWRVKLISSCAMGDSTYSGQAYIVLERDDA